MFEKVKRILALVGVILLAGIYAATLILSLIDSPWAKGWLKVSVVMSVVVPVVIYGYILVYRILKNKRDKDE